MFDVKLTPVTQTLSKLSHAVTELQEFAVHKSDLAVMNLNVQTVADSVPTVSHAVMDHAQRLEKLEEQMCKLTFINDDSWKRLVFIGLPKMSFEERVGAMQAFMLAHFPQITFFDCSVYFALNKSSRKWEEMNIGYIEVSSGAVRDRKWKMRR